MNLRIVLVGCLAALTVSTDAAKLDIGTATIPELQAAYAAGLKSEKVIRVRTLSIETRSSSYVVNDPERVEEQL